MPDDATPGDVMTDDERSPRRAGVVNGLPQSMQ
jgi:hypothetical protein